MNGAHGDEAAEKRASLEHKRRLIEAKLNEIIHLQHQLAFTVFDYQADKSAALFERKMNDGLVRALQELDQLRQDFDVFVPTEVLKYIDGGANPDLYTRDFLNLTVERAQKTSGKVSLFTELEQSLASELQALYPAEMAAYLRANKSGDA